ncbi:MgtC/SapB family protein [Thermosynechococcaceae cyanobacterium Okahandja]
MPWSDFMMRLLAAASFGAALGFERQWRQRMAGLVTNTLVAMGAAIFVMFSLMIPGDTSPTRVAAQVVSGIGFLGGGVILRQGLTIRGLNTAATLWCAAALGILAGGGYVVHGLVATVFVIVANTVLPFLCDRLNLQNQRYTGFEYDYQCEIIARLEEESLIRTILLTSISGDVQVRSLWSQHPVETPDRVVIRLELICHERRDTAVEVLMNRLSLEPGVLATRWSVEERLI